MCALDWFTEINGLRDPGVRYRPDEKAGTVTEKEHVPQGSCPDYYALMISFSVYVCAIVPVRKFVSE